MPVSRKRKKPKRRTPSLSVAVIRHRAAGDPPGRWDYTLVRRPEAGAIAARLAAAGAAAILPRGSLAEAEHVAAHTWAGVLPRDAELPAGTSQDGEWVRWHLPSPPPPVPSGEGGR